MGSPDDKELLGGKPSLVDLRGLDNVAAAARLSAISRFPPARWLVVDVGGPRAWPPDLVEALAGVDQALVRAGGRCAVVARGAGRTAVDSAGAALLWSASREAALVALSARGAVPSVALHAERGGMRIVLRGDVDLADRFVLDTQLERVRALAAPRSRIVLDFRALRFIDVGSLRRLTALQRECAWAGIAVHLLGARAAVQRVISALADLRGPESAGPPERAASADASLLGLDAVSAAAEDAIIVTDLQGRVTAWNRAAERLYGWTAAEVAGRPIGELTVGPQDHRLAEEIMQAIQLAGSWEGEFTVHRRDGSPLLAHVRDTLVRDADGRPAGVRGRSRPVARPQPARTAA